MKRSEVAQAQSEVRAILAKARIPVLASAEVEIADFGLGEYRRTGLGIVVRINEPQYCSKWLTLLPGQRCPWHHHDRKKETFFCHTGLVRLTVEKEEILLRPGAQYTIEPGRDHSFTSDEGAVVEEVSTYDENSDSVFRDRRIVRDPVIEED